MTPEISEHSFEDAIECGLLRHGPDACPEEGFGFAEPALPWGEMGSGGYLKRSPDDYDRALCLIARDAVDFVLATQPREWQRLAEHYGAAVRERFVRRLAAEIERRGALDVLRHGIRDSGVRFRSPGSARRAASTPKRAGSIAATSSPSSASCATARRTRKASISCCS